MNTVYIVSRVVTHSREDDCGDMYKESFTRRLAVCGSKERAEIEIFANQRRIAESLAIKQRRDAFEARWVVNNPRPPEEVRSDGLLTLNCVRRFQEYCEERQRRIKQWFSDCGISEERRQQMALDVSDSEDHDIEFDTEEVPLLP